MSAQDLEVEWKVENSKVVNVDQLQNSRMVNIDGCLFPGRRQAALFITAFML